MRPLPLKMTGGRICAGLCLAMLASLLFWPALGIGQDAAVEDVIPPVPANSRARRVEQVQIRDGRIAFVADGNIRDYRYFTMDGPPRLVVDLRGLKPGFDAQSFSVPAGFQTIRVGQSSDRVRFVLDAPRSGLPDYAIDRQANAVIITWSTSRPAAAVVPEAVASASPVVVPEPVAAPMAPTVPATSIAAPEPAAKPVVNKAVSITSVDFSQQNGRSVLAVGLSGRAELLPVLAAGDMVRIGVKNASISRALRRAIDTSAFPSAIRLITPYTVSAGSGQDVLFAIELKGPMPYELKQVGNRVLFSVEDGPYAEAKPAARSERVVPVATRPAAMASRGSDAPSGTLTSGVPSIDRGPARRYTGQKINLNFDDANIRSIMQLIAEVSKLNIIVGDDVQGTVTLRLVDVPWDQAFDLVLETRGLGQIREGNVVRVMPKEKIRQLQQEQFAAARALEKLEDLTTQVVTVNYSDVNSVAENAKKLLTERGKIVADARDKKLIVTDIPSVVAEIRTLASLLDTPERQVLIEARIVEASATFTRDLGVNWGLTYNNTAGDASGNKASIGGGGTLVGIPISPGQVTSGLVSGLTFGRVGVDKAVLDLRLAALETSGHGRIVSTPRITTLNGMEAEIAQGTEIPYLTTSDQGTKTEFKKAELSLKVTPEINPDGSILLDIEAKNDSRGANVSTGLGQAPAIDTKQATSKVLIRDGETTVIGGIFIQDRQESNAGVPFLKNVPVLGHLFKSTSVSEERRELLVFITPRILD